ncbi:hypothetical protein [Peromfec virus RodF5_9]|uniref:Uncharacterized protein n=1 Tax=Peromfec virus RodF5_9 TaxID=2929345 RepID=A0A976R7U7_9VIRU|nr:hypothetical protein [Peromfec virus RodF5_9]
MSKNSPSQTWLNLLEESFSTSLQSEKCALVHITSGRPYSEKDAARFDYVLKSVQYSHENPLFLAIQRICDVLALPTPVRDESGCTAIKGPIPAACARLFSYSTKAVIRKGVLHITCPPESLEDELLFCYMRFCSRYRNSIKFPEYLDVCLR